MTRPVESRSSIPGAFTHDLLDDIALVRASLYDSQTLQALGRVQGELEHCWKYIAELEQSVYELDNLRR